MKKWVVALSVLFLAGCCGPSTQYYEFNHKPCQHLRVSTYSMKFTPKKCPKNYLTEEAKLLTTINADILFIQDASSKSIQFLNHQLNVKYPYHQDKDFCHQGSMAIFSKYPFKTLHFILPEYGQHPAWTAAFKTPFGIVQGANVHLQSHISQNPLANMVGVPSTPSYKIRAAEMDRILHHLEPNYQKVIIAGNFNESDNDGTVRRLRKLGFCDALMLQRKPQSTWLGRKNPLTVAKRFDRIFSWGQIKPAQVQVLHEGYSDHYPVVVDFIISRRHTTI